MRRHVVRAFCGLMATTVVIFCATSASATTLTLSFTNTIGGVTGTVSFEVQGLTNGTTSKATNVTLLTYPSALDPEINQEGTNVTLWTFQNVNSFTLDASGNLTAADFDASTFNLEGSVDVFVFDTITPPLPGEAPGNPSPLAFLGYGPYTGSLGSGPYPNAVVSVPTVGSTAPEPSGLVLLGTGLIGGIGAIRWKRI